MLYKYIKQNIISISLLTIVSYSYAMEAVEKMKQNCETAIKEGTNGFLQQKCHSQGTERRFNTAFNIKDVTDDSEPSEERCTLEKVTHSGLIQHLINWKDLDNKAEDIDSKRAAGIGKSLLTNLQKFNSMAISALKDKFIFICNSQGELMAVAESVEIKKTSGMRLYLDNIYVDPLRRKQGGGRAAVKAGIIRSIRNGLNGKLFLSPLNDKLKMYYESLGMNCNIKNEYGGIYCAYENIDQIVQKKEKIHSFPELEKLLN